MKKYIYILLGLTVFFLLIFYNKLETAICCNESRIDSLQQIYIDNTNGDRGFYSKNTTSESLFSNVILKNNTDISYSSTYSSSDFSVTEESLENYNMIGEKVGTHWIACHVIKSNTTHPLFPSSYMSTLKSSPKKNLILQHPSILMIKSIGKALSDIISGQCISFQWGKRHSISDINTLNIETATESIIHLPHLSNVPSLKRIINIHRTHTCYTSEKCLASAYVFIGKGDNDPWNKIAIVTDGFDPRSIISIQEIMENVDNSLTPSAYQFISTLTERGYDIVFVDHGYETRDIIDKSRSLLRIIEHISLKNTNPIMVGGYSMGGLIARVALLLGEINNIPCSKRISHYLSIDSPHLGAQINYDMQKIIFDIADNYLKNPIKYLSYEKIARVAFDLNSIPAKQLLFKHVRESHHDVFYDFIKNIGDYPKYPKLYAIGDAAWKWPYPKVNNKGAKAATILGRDIYIKDDDLFPGSYIDLWAAKTDLNITIPLLFKNCVTLNLDIFASRIGMSTYPVIESTFNDTHFKPTFIPLYSALGIPKHIFINLPVPKNQRDIDKITQKYTMFDKMYLVNYNCRPRHIVFNMDLANVVAEVMAQR